MTGYKRIENIKLIARKLLAEVHRSMPTKLLVFESASLMIYLSPSQVWNEIKCYEHVFGIFPSYSPGGVVNFGSHVR